MSDDQLRRDLREILDAMVALFREFQDAAIDARMGEIRPCSESIAYVATLVGKLGDCHKGTALEALRDAIRDYGNACQYDDTSFETWEKVETALANFVRET